MDLSWLNYSLLFLVVNLYMWYYLKKKKKRIYMHNDNNIYYYIEIIINLLTHPPSFGSAILQ